jgi:NADH dehydrogenase [ubiquinone] 1 alpha subcomplex assembly factor 7
VGEAGAAAEGVVTASALAARIARRIRREGPLSLAAFMAMALHDPEHGYYARRQPVGGAGDFVTAPEISQIFGELIGLWCADLWQRIGRPESVTLCELGPGRGTLMSDFLRAAASLPPFRRAIRLYLVEASPRLRAE